MVEVGRGSEFAGVEGALAGNGDAGEGAGVGVVGVDAEDADGAGGGRGVAAEFFAGEGGNEGFFGHHRLEDHAGTEAGGEAAVEGQGVLALLAQDAALEGHGVGAALHVGADDLGPLGEDGLVGRGGGDEGGDGFTAGGVDELEGDEGLAGFFEDFAGDAVGEGGSVAGEGAVAFEEIDARGGAEGAEEFVAVQAAEVGVALAYW